MSKGLPYLLGFNTPKIKPKNYVVAPTPLDVTEYLLNIKPLDLPVTKTINKKKLANDYYTKDDRGNSKGAFEKFTAAGKNGYAKKEKDILEYISEVKKKYGD